MDWAATNEGFVYPLTNGLYSVRFYGNQIDVLVTHDPARVANWISTLEATFNGVILDRFVVGFDITCRPSFNFWWEYPVATLNLCVGCRCLIFQILYCDRGIPDELRDFLSNENYTFVGVDIRDDVEKLYRDCGIHVGGRIVELKALANQRWEENMLWNFELYGLASILLGRFFSQLAAAMNWSSWDNRWLTFDQIMYASVVAFGSFKIGIHLRAWDN